MDGHNKIQQEFVNNVTQFMRYINKTFPLPTSYTDYTDITDIAVHCFFKPTIRDYELILREMINLSKKLPSDKQQTYLDLANTLIKYIIFKYNRYPYSTDIMGIIDNNVIYDIIKPSGGECVALINKIIYLLK